MSLVKKTSLLVFTLASTGVNALTLDYRHEFKADSEVQSNRLKLAHTTEEGFFFEVEGTMAEGQDANADGFNSGNGNWSGNGSEWEMGKAFQVTDKIVLSPAVNLDVGDSAIGYRVQLKSIYTITENWFTTLRWRGGIEKNESSDVNDKNYNQINWEVGYKNNVFSITGDYEYRFTNYEDYKGDHNYSLYNVTVAVPINMQWVPYTEIGYVPRYNSDHTQDEMEMRYRLGIKYNF